MQPSGRAPVWVEDWNAAQLWSTCLGGGLGCSSGVEHLPRWMTEAAAQLWSICLGGGLGYSSGVEHLLRWRTRIQLSHRAPA